MGKKLTGTAKALVEATINHMEQAVADALAAKNDKIEFHFPANASDLLLQAIGKLQMRMSAIYGRYCAAERQQLIEDEFGIEAQVDHDLP